MITPILLAKEWSNNAWGNQKVEKTVKILKVELSVHRVLLTLSVWPFISKLLTTINNHKKHVGTSTDSVAIWCYLERKCLSSHLTCIFTFMKGRLLDSKTKSYHDSIINANFTKINNLQLYFIAIQSLLYRNYAWSIMFSYLSNDNLIDLSERGNCCDNVNTIIGRLTTTSNEETFLKIFMKFWSERIVVFVASSNF